jgi:hypothetical protein
MVCQPGPITLQTGFATRCLLFAPARHRRPEVICGSGIGKISLFQKTEFPIRDTRRRVGLLALWRDRKTFRAFSDLSVGGLFLSTPIPQAVGVKAHLIFSSRKETFGSVEVRHLVPSGDWV